MQAPIGALGGGVTIRIWHVVLLCVLIVLILAVSKNPFARVFSRILVVMLVVHYLNTRAHVNHNRRYLTIKTRQAIPQTEVLRKLNDFLNYATLVLLAAVAASKGVLIPITDLYLLAQLIRAVIIVAYKPMPDRSGMCEERSLRRHSLFENCGTLRVSGHIMGAVFLSYLVPSIGLPLIVLQTILILSSKSHYPGDVALGIVVASALLLAYHRQKQLFLKKKKM